jgi:Ca2+:H+ antiporter
MSGVGCYIRPSVFSGRERARMAAHHDVDNVPLWTWVAPVAAAVLLGLKLTHVIPADNGIVLALAAVLLAGAVFAAVHHAEIIALKVGEPFGSIVLAVAITVIEVALIISILMGASAGSEFLARDTVFATVMIVLNGIIGMCLIVGGMRHHEQTFQTNAASSALSVLGTLATITLVLPNYTLTTTGPNYNASQLIFVSLSCLVLYGVFLFVQTIRHRDYFLADESEELPLHDTPNSRTTTLSVALLLVSLVSVVLLAKTLSPALEAAIADAGLPKAFLGVVIAALVLMPEGMAAVRAAASNRLQTSLNLALGSAMATIGLTIPAVSAFALMSGMTLQLGLGPEEMALLVLSLFIGTVTLATGRTTILQGTVHLVIFGVFLFLSAVP